MSGQLKIFQYTNGEDSFQTYIDLLGDDNGIENIERSNRKIIPIYVDYNGINFRNILNYYRNNSYGTITNKVLQHDLERLPIAINCESMIVNVEGHRYEVGVRTLKMIPYFRGLINFGFQTQKKNNETSLIDRDHLYFRYLISFLRNPFGNLSEHRLSMIPQEEFAFYGLPLNRLFGKKDYISLIQTNQFQRTNNKDDDMPEILEYIYTRRLLTNKYVIQKFNYVPNLGRLCECTINMDNHKSRISNIYLYVKLNEPHLMKTLYPIRFIEIINDKGKSIVKYPMDVIQKLQEKPFNLYEKNVPDLAQGLELIKIDILNKKIFPRSLTVRVFFEELMSIVTLETSFLVVKYEESSLDKKSDEDEKILLPGYYSYDIFMDPKIKEIVIKDSLSIDSIFLIIYFDYFNDLIDMGPNLSVKLLFDQEEVCLIRNQENMQTQIKNFQNYDPCFWVIDLSEIIKRVYCERMPDPNFYFDNRLEYEYEVKIGNLPTKIMENINQKTLRCSKFTLDLKNDTII